MTIGQTLAYGGGITLIGMGVVFTGLILLVFISMAMSKLIQSTKKEEAEPEIQPEAPLQTQAQSSVEKGELSAIVAAGIAAAIGTDPGSLRIHSITPAGRRLRTVQVAAKSELNAVIYASVASALGEPAGGLRIHSIRKLN